MSEDSIPEVPHYLDNLDEYLRVIRLEVETLAEASALPKHFVVPDEMLECHGSAGLLAQAQWDMIESYSRKFDLFASAWTEAISAWIAGGGPNSTK